MPPVNRKAPDVLRDNGEQNFTSSDENVYYFEKEKEKRLDKKNNDFIDDIASRFNNVSGNAETKKDLLVKLAQKLGFGEMLGEAAVRAVAREKARTRRARMSPEQADEERAYVRDMMRAHRARMSPERAEEERAKARERMRKKRAASLNP